MKPLSAISPRSEANSPVRVSRTKPSSSGSIVLWPIISASAEMPSHLCTTYMRSSPPNRGSASDGRAASISETLMAAIDAAPMAMPSAGPLP